MIAAAPPVTPRTIFKVVWSSSVFGGCLCVALPFVSPQVVFVSENNKKWHMQDKHYIYILHLRTLLTHTLLFWHFLALPIVSPQVVFF